MFTSRYLIVLIPLFIACSAKHKVVEKAPAPQPTEVWAHTVDVSVPSYSVPVQEMQADSLSTWASSIRLVCNAQKCPPQVGLLVFVTTENNMIYFNRCTASLIGADKIITNGHCDKHEGHQGYFITQKINGKQRQIKIKDLEFKQYSEENKHETGVIDVAIFSLTQSVDAKYITPFDLPKEATPDFQKLYAYVINQGKEENTFVIDEKICTPKRHEVIFPFDFSENPDTFSVINCEVIPGNSGAPILASPSSATVEALVVGFTSIQMKLESFDRPLYVYENYVEMQATNLRCANIIDGQAIVPNCAPTNQEVLNRRVNEYFQESMSMINNRELEDANNRLFEYEAYAAEVINTQNPPNRRFVIYHLPKCRKQNGNPQSIPIIIEDVEFGYDEFARVKVKIIETKETQALVTKAYSNHVFGLKIQWPTVAGEFLSTPASLQLGTEFNYSIPLCK